jgi:hypothetical protein
MTAAAQARLGELKERTGNVTNTLCGRIIYTPSVRIAKAIWHVAMR